MDPNMLRALQAQYPCVALPPIPGRDEMQIVTGPVRLAFAYLDKPKPNKLNPGKQPEYTALFIVPPGSDISALLRTVETLAAGRFGPGWKSLPNFNNDVKPQAGMVAKFKAKGRDLPGFSSDPSAVYLDAATMFQPPTLDMNKQFMPVSVDQTGIYSGCWVRAHLRVYAYPKDRAPAKAQGIGLGLISVMKIADDEMFRGNQTDFGAAYDTPAHPSAAAAPQYAQPAPAAPQYQAPQPAPAAPQYQAPQPAYAPQPAPSYPAPGAGPVYAPQPQYAQQHAPAAHLGQYDPRQQAQHPGAPMQLPGFGPQQ